MDEKTFLYIQEDIKALEECTGDCDYCKYKYTVPGTDERIDREPQYYCGLFQGDI